MAVDDAQATPPLPADYYRRHAARVRRLADEATTPALKEHLREVAGQYERLAERVEGAGFLDNGANGGAGGHD